MINSVTWQALSLEDDLEREKVLEKLRLADDPT